MNEHDFDESPRQLWVCAYGEDCARETVARHGSATAIYDALKAERNAQGLKRKLYVVRTSCQGWCEYAPVCQLAPEGRVFKDLQPGQAKAFIAQAVQGAEAVKADFVWDYRLSRQENLKLRDGK